MLDAVPGVDGAVVKTSRISRRFKPARKSVFLMFNSPLINLINKSMC